jgi:hypothetical protein
MIRLLTALVSEQREHARKLTNPAESCGAECALIGLLARYCVSQGYSLETSRAIFVDAGFESYVCENVLIGSYAGAKLKPGKF